MTKHGNCFVAVKMKRLPTLNTEKSWKEFMMPASLRTGWIRLILRSFKKILSCKKIYLVQRAEMRFHRELLKGVRDNKRWKRTSTGKEEIAYPFSKSLYR